MLMVSTVLTLGVILVNGWTDAPNAIACLLYTSIELQAVGSAKMQLSPAVRAIQQSCKQALSSRFRVPALVAAQLLHPVKQFL